MLVLLLQCSLFKESHGWVKTLHEWGNLFPPLPYWKFRANPTVKESSDIRLVTDVPGSAPAGESHGPVSKLRKA
jgi:hypothetical protein